MRQCACRDAIYRVRINSANDGTICRDAIHRVRINGALSPDITIRAHYALRVLRARATKALLTSG